MIHDYTLRIGCENDLGSSHPSQGPLKYALGQSADKKDGASTRHDDVVVVI